MQATIEQNIAEHQGSTHKFGRERLLEWLEAAKESNHETCLVSVVILDLILSSEDQLLKEAATKFIKESRERLLSPDGIKELSREGDGEDLAALIAAAALCS